MLKLTIGQRRKAAGLGLLNGIALAIIMVFAEPPRVFRKLVGLSHAAMPAERVCQSAQGSVA